MYKLIFYQSGDISDAITEVTKGLGNASTFFLIMGFIIYLILRRIANKSNKKNK